MSTTSPQADGYNLLVATSFHRACNLPTARSRCSIRSNRGNRSVELKIRPQSSPSKAWRAAAHVKPRFECIDVYPRNHSWTRLQFASLFQGPMVIGRMDCDRIIGGPRVWNVHRHAVPPWISGQQWGLLSAEMLQNMGCRCHKSPNDCYMEYCTVVLHCASVTYIVAVVALGTWPGRLLLLQILSRVVPRLVILQFSSP